MSPVEEKAVAIARTWLGTPFVAGASVIGVGTDCAGLIEGIAQTLEVDCPSRLAVEADLARAAMTCLAEVSEPKAGDILLFSAQIGGPPLHVAILTDTNTIIHAHWRAGVVENRFGNWFKARLTHCFAWPEAATMKDI
jgi:NlpC/P60 family putative phage cell wall peptidase